MKRGSQLRSRAKLAEVISKVGLDLLANMNSLSLVYSTHTGHLRFSLFEDLLQCLLKVLHLLRNQYVRMNLFDRLAFDSLIFSLLEIYLLMLHRQQILLTFDLIYLHFKTFLIFNLLDFHLHLHLHFLNQHRCCFCNSRQSFYSFYFKLVGGIFIFILL